jgi:uncharacterized protein (DUF433 family)
MPFKARAGGQGRVRGGRVGAQQGTGGTPGSPTPDPSLAVSIGTNVALGVGSWTSPGSLSAETTQFFNRLLTLPSPTRQDLYSALIDGLVADGVWSSLDVLCVAGADAATSLTNLVQNPYGASYFGTPTFTADRGITPAGIVSYIDSGVNPSTIVGNYSQNSGSIAAWNLGTTQANQALIRSIADVNCELWPKYSTGVSFWMVNNSGGTEDSATNSGDSSGFFLATRTASNATALYRNGTSLGTSATASVAPENNELLIGYGVNIAVAWQIASWAFGGGLNATKATALYNRVQTYLHAIGAV